MVELGETFAAWTVGPAIPYLLYPICRDPSALFAFCQHCRGLLEGKVGGWQDGKVEAKRAWSNHWEDEVHSSWDPMSRIRPRVSMLISIGLRSANPTYWCLSDEVFKRIASCFFVSLRGQSSRKGIPSALQRFCALPAHIYFPRLDSSEHVLHACGMLLR